MVEPKRADVDGVRGPKRSRTTCRHDGSAPRWRTDSHVDGTNLKVRPGTVHVLVVEGGAQQVDADERPVRRLHDRPGRDRLQSPAARRAGYGAALERGISTIHQELSPILGVTIAEYVFLGREPSHATRVLKYFAAFDRMFSDIKALIVVMDEPTSAIDDTEVAMLSRRTADLEKSGINIVCNTQDGRNFQIADDVTMMRDGQFDLPATTVDDPQRRNQRATPMFEGLGFHIEGSRS